ncbi:MAG: hypothetical protein PHI40_07790 [Caldisericia bacterium]|nr:hypothetical protein [Caldisericia bacterium]
MRLKRLISVLLVLIIISILSLNSFQIFTVNAETDYFWTDSGIRAVSFSVTGINTISITSGAELGLFAYNITNNINLYNGYTITLAYDIDLSAHYWIPIGTADCRFNGTFDGAGYSILNLYMISDISTIGLFSHTGYNAVIKNLTLTGSINSQYGNGASSFVGENYGKIYNCFNLASVNSDFKACGISIYNYGEVKNCVNVGSISSGSADGAALVYYNYLVSSVSNCYYLSGFPVVSSNTGNVSNTYTISKSGTTCTLSNTSSFSVNGTVLPANANLVTALNAWVNGNTSVYRDWRIAKSILEHNGYPVMNSFFINVNITWGSLSYKYKETWNTNTRRNTYSWSPTQPGVSNLIVITNNSSTNVICSCVFRSDTTVTGVSGSLTNVEGYPCTSELEIYPAPHLLSSWHFLLVLSGTPSTTNLSNTKVGSLTITINATT